MKKNLFVLATSLIFYCTVDGMEKIKIWLGFIKKQEYKMEDDNQCTICLDPLSIKPPIPRTILACNHIFHHTCISQWVANQNNCPICRTAISSEIKDFKKQSSSHSQNEPNPNSYFIKPVDFLARILIRSPQAIPTFASALPILLYLDDKPTIKNLLFSAELCGVGSFLSLMWWQGDKTKPWEKTADTEFFGHIRANSKNYALTNASIIMNACMIKAIRHTQNYYELTAFESIATVIVGIAVQHDAMMHLMDREES